MLAVVAGQVKQQTQVAQHHLVAVQEVTHRLTVQQELQILAVAAVVDMVAGQVVAALAVLA
jgi:hypothetical protein